MSCTEERGVSVFRRVSQYDPAELDAAVEDIFTRGGFEKGNLAGKKIIIKVNALMKASPDEAVTTHPAVVAAIISALKRRGADNILIADCPSGVYSPARSAGIFASCGFAELRGEGVELLCDNETAHIAAGGSVAGFDILKCVAEADIVIGAGKLKTHALTGMTGAVKNYFGTISGLTKAEFHCRFPDSGEFVQMLCELCCAIKPDFNIIDAVCGMQGNGPSGGEKREFGFIAGSSDAFALDRLLARSLGLEVGEALTVAKSVELGLAPQDWRECPAAGDVDLLECPISDLKRPDSVPSTNLVSGNGIARIIRKAAAPRPVIRHGDCVGCGRCAEICPQHTIAIKDRKAYINRKNCVRCFCCHEVCPQRAIDIKRNVLFRLVR